MGKILEKQSSPCHCLNLRRAALSITKIYDYWLIPSGLRPSQYSLLRHLRRLGTVSVSDLASAIRLDRTTLVRKIKPLEREFLIIDVSQKGARNRQLQLSETGMERLEEADKLWSKAQEFIDVRLGKDNVKKLTELLSAIESLESLCQKGNNN